MKKRHVIFIATIACFILILAALDTRLLVVHETVASEKITQPVRIGLVTDLHSCWYGENQKELVQELEQQNLDLLLYGGDICDDVRPHDGAASLLQQLAGRYPAFYVSGNHEYWSGEADDVKELFRGYGVTVLEGESVPLQVGGQELIISGVDDAAAGEALMLQQVDACAAGGYEAFHLLLAHRPEYAEVYAEKGFDLVLSGHAHGGQWRIPGMVNGVFAPNQGWFPRYAGGRYALQETVMVVSRGLAKGTTRIPRIFNRPELVILELVPD